MTKVILFCNGQQIIVDKEELEKRLYDPFPQKPKGDTKDDEKNRSDD